MAHIMTIDDSRTIRLMVKTILESEGHSIIEAEDGMDAMSKARQETQIDMFVVDVNMPRMNGISFVGSVRKLPKYASLPILMLTTETSSYKKDKAKDIGANGWLNKPFEPPQLLNAVSTLLKKHADKTSNVT